MSAVEVWLDVVGYAGIYEVSNFGSVRSVPRTSVRSNGVIARLQGHALRTWPDPKTGYARVCLSRDGHDLLERVHRVVARAFHGEPLAGQVVRHRNGDGTNSAASNLEWGTESENELDSVRHGTHSQAAKTVCPRGHELRAPNLRASVAAHGWRGCLACKRAVDECRKHPERDLRAVADMRYAGIMGRAA